MKVFQIFVLLLLSPAVLLAIGKPENNFHLLSANTLDGQAESFSKYDGKVLLVTNIALKCGTTPQLKALQELYEEFSPQGLVVMGFPSNDFTGEDVSKHETIKSDCKKKFGVSFPLYAPGGVSGPEKQAVFEYLASNGTPDMQGEVGFNFEKFLIDRFGMLRRRYGSFTGAQSEVMRTEIKKLLAEK